MVIARPFELRCPRCRKKMTSFTEILFLDNFTVVVNGICCSAEITSGELNILELLPSKSNEKTH